MSQPAVVAAARALWTELSATSVAFPEVGLTVATSPSSRLCPPGWAGLVFLGASAIATAPDDEAADLVRKRLAALPIERVGVFEHTGAVVDALNPAAVLGPAALAYLDSAEFRPAAPSVATASLTIERLPAGHEDLRALERLCAQAESDEAGIDEITSPVFALRENGAVIAAAGYVHWPSRTAHLSILTAPAARGRGLARITGSAAVAHALAAGKLPQWRARVPASRSVARALGFRELGTQISVRLSRGRAGSRTGPHGH